MMTRTSLRLAMAVLAGVTYAGAAVSAQSGSARTLYQRAQDRETAVRKAKSPSAASIQSAMTAYENIVRRYPVSGYSDNALWQAAGLALLAYSKSGDATDKTTGERYLTWLAKEYPSSSLVKEIPDRRREFSAASPIPAAPAPSGAGAAGSPAGTGTGTAATLTAISRQSIPGGDRIVLSFDREVPFTTDRIANPDRVWVDFEGAALSDGAEAQADGVKGFGIAAVRVGHPTPATTRVVLDLAGAPRHSIYPMYGPYRLVIDTEGAVPPPLTHTLVTEPAANTVPSGPTAAPVPAANAPAETPAATAKPPAMPRVPPAPVALPPSLTKGGDYSLARQLGLGVQRIVIDAGHGGHDPGAQGNGIVEKDLVLDIALRLQTLLAEQPGVEVVLTRDTDVFIPLEERTAIANRAGADLFLSIHANASTRKEARGLETYYLNFASNPEAEAVAARENATSSQSMGHLPELVKAIALNNKLAESREFAGLVQTNMVRKLKQQNKTVRDLGVKQAPFVVLIGAAMPSVLAEISFLTNKTEASLLKQNAYKNRIAQALCDAVLKYQTSLKKVTTVASK